MLEVIEMTNVVEFFKKKEVFVLNFKTSDVISFTKDESHNDIVLEVQDNKGTAWVPALNRNEARKRLHSMMSVLEWEEE